MIQTSPYKCFRKKIEEISFLGSSFSENLNLASKLTDEIEKQSRIKPYIFVFLNFQYEIKPHIKNGISSTMAVKSSWSTEIAIVINAFFHFISLFQADRSSPRSKGTSVTQFRPHLHLLLCSVGKIAIPTVSAGIVCTWEALNPRAISYQLEKQLPC